MRSGGTLKFALAAIVVVIVVGGLAVGIFTWMSHKQADTRTALESGYATQPLGAPFVLESKAWNAGPEQWQYNYTANVNPAAAIIAAKAQLGRGAYQVDANQPDVINNAAGTATLYRDLITEDVALTMHIQPPAAQGSAPITIATVTLSSLAGQ